MSTAGESSAAVRMVVKPADAGQRLDLLLTTSGAAVSRAQAQALLRAGRVSVGGLQKKASYVVRSGDVVCASVEPRVERPTRGPLPQPEPLPLTVLFEDDELMVVNKASGVVVHPAPGHWEGTLVSAILHHLGRSPESGDSTRPGIVHRLDKDTSGVLVVAKTALAHVRLSAQFRERTIEKRYLAVVRGKMPKREGSIEHPIGRHPKERQRMSIRTHRGRPSTTRYVVVSDHGAASVLHLFPTTGRTHQLRVHLASTGHPIVGDKVYGRLRSRGRGVGGAMQEIFSKFPRQALHAERLGFAHPVGGERVCVRAPLPADLERLIREIGEHGGGEALPHESAGSA